MDVVLGKILDQFLIRRIRAVDPNRVSFTISGRHALHHPLYLIFVHASINALIDRVVLVVEVCHRSQTQILLFQTRIL